MRRIFLFVVFSVMLLSLWGCNSSTQSQNHEATIEQAASTNRPFITKWQGTAGKELLGDVYPNVVQRGNPQ